MNIPQEGKSSGAFRFNRTDIWTYIDGVRKKQEKVRGLINQGQSIEEVKDQFLDHDRYFIETMYSEIKNRIKR